MWSGDLKASLTIAAEKSIHKTSSTLQLTNANIKTVQTFSVQIDQIIIYEPRCPKHALSIDIHSTTLLDYMKEWCRHNSNID